MLRVLAGIRSVGRGEGCHGVLCADESFSPTNGNGCTGYPMTMSMKKNSGDLLISGVLAVMWLTLSVFSPVYSEEAQELMEKKSVVGRWLSDDASAKVKMEKYTIQEQRVGGRLERITVYHDNRLTDTYENSAVDSMWLSAEKELGEMPNVRRWTIGSW